MKVLIGYDGSPSAEAALEELKRTGLPASDAKVLIVTVGDVWMLPEEDFASLSGGGVDFAPRGANIGATANARPADVKKS